MFSEEWPYEVSNKGSVRSIRTGTILTKKPNCRGYVSVYLKNRSGHKKRFYTHRLVAIAHIGEIKEGMCVNHKNYIRDDNRVENLEIVTLKENIEWSSNAGRYSGNSDNAPKGNDSPHSKLTEDDVGMIRKLYAKGATYQHLGDMYGVTKRQIGNIINRVSWRHI